MPIPLFNSIASWILKKRIHQMELFTKYPNEVQNELLFNLLRNAQNTEIGKKYSFSEINSYDVFKKNIPINTYEDVEVDIERCRKGEQNIFGLLKLNGLQNLVERPILEASLYP